MGSIEDESLSKGKFAMDNQELIPHLFRTECRKITAVLCRHFGIEHMQVAEDIAADTFLLAFEVWPYKGIPPNPTAWLYSVAKHKAKKYLRRSRVYEQKILPALSTAALQEADAEIDLSPGHIEDSQLQMMFAICHPSLTPEAQVGLSLRILCGFGIGEIADAFLTNKETINKRLYRAREKLREEKIKIEMPSPEVIEERLDPVLTTLYLLFSEGYYSTSQDEVLRKDLCLEAMRLCYLLVENERTNKPRVNALLSLMCFHASRFDARMDNQGELILYDDQDTGLWNAELISRGSYYLHCASRGNSLSNFHLEAAIAFWNTQKEDTVEKWQTLLYLYDELMMLSPSPMAALNRAFAVSRVHGKEAGIREAEKLQQTSNQFYFALLGSLYTGLDNDTAKEHFQKALSLARSLPDRHAIEKKLESLDKQ